jgi:sugar lactone lactonase YvrE
MKAFLRMTLICFFVSQWNLHCFAQVGIITTYAGPAAGAPGPTQAINGTQAVAQSVYCPAAIAHDGAGGFYIVSSYLNGVLRVSKDGQLFWVAGGIDTGFSGDGGPATSARLNNPNGIAMDSAGNLFIADTTNNRIRKISSSGIITTVAGNGTSGYSGDGGQATSAQLDSPHAVAVDSFGNLFIADSDNHRIRKVDSSGFITTAAGIGSGWNSAKYSGDGGPAILAKLWQPEGIAVDSAGNLFISDSSNNRIRKVDSSGIITTVAGNGTTEFSGDGGPATEARIMNPRDIAVDSAGNFFFADSLNSRIRKVSSLGIITTVAGSGPSGFSSGGYSGDNGPATSALLKWPTGVALDSEGNLCIADTNNNRIRKVSSAEIITTIAGNGIGGGFGDGVPGISALVERPTGVAIDSAGNLFIADTWHHRIRKVSAAGIISTMAGNGIQGGSGDSGPATSAELNNPNGIAVDSEGNLFISDTGNNCIRKVIPAGIITTVAGGFNNAKGIAVDSTGNLFILDNFGDSIRKISSAGVTTTVAGGIIGYSDGIAVDSAGNLYVAYTAGNSILKISSSGIITTIAGNGIKGFSGDGGPAASAQLFYPSGIAVDSAGTLYIADTWNHRIRRISSSGIIMTLVGSGPIDQGMGGFGGDGGPAAAALLNTPYAAAVDSAGNLFIADNYITSAFAK